jgi:transcriptional regulator with XRE-family HTH domain
MPKIARSDALLHWAIDHGLHTYRALADQAGVSERTIGRIVSGGNAGDRTVGALLTLTGLPFDTLFQFIPAQAQRPEPGTTECHAGNASQAA